MPIRQRCTSSKCMLALAIVLVAAMLEPICSFQLSSSIQRSTPTSLQSTKQEEENPTTWKPTISSLSDRKSFFREQSLLRNENLGTLCFHHVEFYTGDALMTAKRFELALGIPITCWSSLATGNDVCVTYGLECGVENEGAREPGEGLRFMITAPLSRAMQRNKPEKLQGRMFK